MSEEKNRPVDKFRSGVFEAAIWKNQIEKDGKVFEAESIGLKKSIKIGDSWKDSVIYINKNELTNAILLLQKAQNKLYLKEAEEDGAKQE